MSKKDEALKLALEALKQIDEAMPFPVAKLAQKVIREALAEQPAQGCEFCSHPLYAGTKCKNCGREQPAQQQEPVAWMDGYRNIYSLEEKAAGCKEGNIPLYTRPQPAAQWVGLTADDVWQSNEVMALNAEMGLTMVQIMALMVWANSKLREKNTGETK